MKYIINEEKNIEVTDEQLHLMWHMALSGEGSDLCLQRGFLPVPIHFYQPIPNIGDLKRRDVWNSVSELKGIKFEPEKYWSYLEEIAKNYQDECNWAQEKIDDESFYVSNSCFGYGCASTLHSTIRSVKPKKIIEVGSGFSSIIIRNALELNKKEGFDTEYIIIDPYTDYKDKLLPEWITVIDNPVESVDVELFKSLGENDILFIDSSHMCKIGSDVKYEILEILPILSEDVLIHFHDIPMPYEYPEVYSTNPSFRVFWNESYFLQAFLAFNDSFEIILPVGYMQKNNPNRFFDIFPHGKKVVSPDSQSFWIKRIKK